MGRLPVSQARPLTSDPHPETLAPSGARCSLPASWASILGCRGRRDGGEAPGPSAAWSYLDSARPPFCGALRWRGRSHPPPPAAATSFVVAFVSRRAHGPGSSVLKVTAL